MRQAAEEVATVMRASPHTADVSFDWNEMAKAVHLDVDQDRARALGVSTQDLSLALQTLLVGASVTQVREGDQLVDVVLRATPAEPLNLSELADINVPTASGRYVPLAQGVKIRHELETGQIWRRNRVPTVTVMADLRDNFSAIFIRIASSPSADFRASSMGSGGGSGTAYCPPVICFLNDAKLPGDGEYIANRPPTNDPALAFLRSIWPASSPLKKSDATSLDADL